MFSQGRGVERFILSWFRAVAAALAVPQVGSTLSLSVFGDKTVPACCVLGAFPLGHCALEERAPALRPDERLTGAEIPIHPGQGSVARVGPRAAQPSGFGEPEACGQCPTQHRGSVGLGTSHTVQPNYRYLG